MKVLALCTGLVLLAIAAGLGRGGLPPEPASGFWLRLLASLPAETSESLLAARGAPVKCPR